MLRIRGYQPLRGPSIPIAVLCVMKTRRTSLKSEGHLLNLLDRPSLLFSPFGIYVWIEQEEREKKVVPP
jgi:hypothetical protein